MFVYLIAALPPVYKIGMSRCPKKRCQSLSHRDNPLSLVHQIPTSVPRFVEHALHGYFEKKRIHGEWFRLDAEDVRRICSIKSWASPFDFPWWMRRRTPYRLLKRHQAFTNSFVLMRQQWENEGENPLTTCPKKKAEIAARIEAFRLLRGLTKSAVGRAVGVFSDTMWKLSKGRVSLSAARIRRFAEALGVTPEELYGSPLEIEHAEEAAAPVPCPPTPGVARGEGDEPLQGRAADRADDSGVR